MEHVQSDYRLDRRPIRGQYEKSPTNTSHLAAELLKPQDTSQLITDFDSGFTPVRDVGRMITGHRTAILEASQNNKLQAMETSYPEIFSWPVQNLHERVVSGPQDQPVGHNFFVNATGFLKAQLPWAVQLDDLLRLRMGVSMYDIAQSDDMIGKDNILAELTKNPDQELKTILATYLAGRSLEGEKYLNKHYEQILQQAKENVKETTEEIGKATGLSDDMLERATEQLQRATFGSFDHLEGLVTSGNTGVAGDYLTGSLRIEIHFDGSIRSAKLRDNADAHHIIAHELQHASSAQIVDEDRCGLRVGNEGLEANEGMTEYLAQLSIGSPGINKLEDGKLYIREDVPYRVAVLAMLALHEQFQAGKNNHFAVLFNTYHGCIYNQSQLEQALDAFYQYDAAISRHLTS